MSINSRYTYADVYKEREMAATCTAAQDDDASTSSFYSTEEEEEDMALAERDTRRLLRAENDPRYIGTLPATGLYPQLHGVAPAQVTALPPPTVAAVSSTAQHHTQYGSVSSSVPPNGNGRRNKPKGKRYRLPFLILLCFDCGLVIFLSIIAYDSKNKESIPKLAYFEMDLKSNYFDLVLLGMLRLFLNALLYLLMAWVTRAVMGITTVVSAVYVPLKAFYCWPLTQSDDGDFQDNIPILLILFVSFVMPWAEAFFFEFKYLPAELARLSTTSWRRWEFWLWPRSLVRTDLDDPPSLPTVVEQLPQRPNIITTNSHSRHYAASTVSLDFRTPMGSTRNSPIPSYMLHGERSCTAPDDDLPPISEEATPSPMHRERPFIRHTFSEEDQRYKDEGERVLQQMIEFTDNNNSWKYEKMSDGIIFHSMSWQGKKIWKAEREMALTPLQLWNILYPGDQMPQWNPQCTKNESMYKIDDETDVVYSVTSSMGPVSSRDFVSLRQISVSDDCYISASAATVYDPKPPQSGKVRGENGPCGYKVVPTGDGNALFIWVLNTDLKGWLPQSVIDQTLCGVISATFRKLQTFIEHRRSEGRL